MLWPDKNVSSLFFSNKNQKLKDTVHLNLRFTGWFGLQGTLKISLFQPFCCGHRHLPLGQVAQSHILHCLECFQGLRIHSFSGKSVLVPFHPHSLELPNIKFKLALYQLEALLPCPISTCSCKRSPSGFL